MPVDVNKLRNSDFSIGKLAPNGWTWSAKRGAMRWRRPDQDTSDPTLGTILESQNAVGTATWSQVVTCKPGEFYHVAATLTCDLGSLDGDGGFVISIQPVVDGRRNGLPRLTPVLHRSSKPIDVRAYYEVPEGVRRVECSVGIHRARGWAHIQHVRFMEILEPDEESHLLTIPLPAHAVPPIKRSRSIVVVHDENALPVIMNLLSAYFGQQQVKGMLSKDGFQSCRADAILISTPKPPSTIRTVQDLERLAVDRLVVISLSAFAQLARGKLVVRRVEQVDDPIHAKVMFANAFTRGFALWDVFPYAWSGRKPGSFVQNQFRRSPEQEAFCRKHGYTTLLVSMCCQDVTSNRPICLFKMTDGGAVVLLDIDPVAETPTTYGESVSAVHWLLSILGHPQSHLGQYHVPSRREAGFRELIREMGQRFEALKVYDDGGPVEEVHDQLVVIGGEEQSFGLPLMPKPAIVVRTGLRSGDAESIYGAFTWFKQLVRMPPHECSYARALASRFRLAWVPSSSGWNEKDGIQAIEVSADGAPELDCEPGQMAALIDIVSHSRNVIRVVVPARDSTYVLLARWLPSLFKAFRPGCEFLYTVDENEGFADRDKFSWRPVNYSVRIEIDPSVFQDSVYQNVLSAGGQVIRLVVPGYDFDFKSYSVQRTDLVATLLEQIIGLQFGLLAVNRSSAPVHYDGFPIVAPGAALVVPHDDSSLRTFASQAG
ncbi:MAG: hypothetical protein AABZ47_13845 [Planctomycetota bacterium]